MSASNTKDAASGIETAGPGSRLKVAREAQGLDLGRVAAQLHLGEDILSALEADDYSKLPGAVFIQGYMRNYARMMGMPVEPLLDAFQRANHFEKPQTILNISKVRHEVHSNHAVVRSITWAIILGLLALLAVWWQGYLQWPTTGESDATSPVDEQPAALTEESEHDPEMPVLMGIPDLGDEDDGGESELSTTVVPVVEEPVESEAADNTLLAEAPSVQEVAASEEVVVTDSAEADTPATDEAATEASVVVVFKDSCWVDIKDVDRSHRVFGVKPTGTRLTLEGNPPYKFVIGNAAAVEIMVDGEPFDFSEHTHANVARFALDPE
ncbi:MAG: RodZ domain-containing protein [Sedimenticola sp.]